LYMLLALIYSSLQSDSMVKDFERGMILMAKQIGRAI
jgi:hypothetical protein